MTPVTAPSLVELASVAIRNQILSGELRPGQRLREEELAALLGISRPPLREALRLLQREGLVTATARKGASVTPLTEQDAWEIATLRASLEHLAMRLAIPVRQPARLAACHASLEKMAAAARKKDRAALTNASFDFHVSVVALAGHRRLTETYQSLSLQMHLCMAMNVRARERRLGESLRDNVARHRVLLREIEQGNVEKVMEAFRSHGERAYLAEFFAGAETRTPAEVVKKSVSKSS